MGEWSHGARKHQSVNDGLKGFKIEAGTDHGLVLAGLMVGS
jgi:hypothetical protein